MQRDQHPHWHLVKVACVLGLMFLTGALLYLPEELWAGGPPAPITVSTSGAPWGNLYFPVQQMGSFTAEVDATPLATTTDSGVGLSNGPQTVFTGLACIGRFNSSGFIDARNGDSYAAVTSIPYATNRTYHFRFVVSLSSYTYSLYVTPPGQAERTVALNYAFRTEQQSVTVLNNWSVFADIGSMKVSNFLAASATVIANSTWTNTSFATQNPSFEVSWDAMPTATGMDGVMALSNGAQTTFPGFACLVRFSTNGTIQARNGGVYTADITLSYSPNVMYHFHVSVNMARHTYSVYVTPSGDTEQLLANNYAFRTEQAGVTQLNTIGVIVDTSTGSLRFGNFAITANVYNQAILADHPVAFWNINAAGTSESDLTGNENIGTYQGGAPRVSTLPNGDQAAVFNGSTQYLSVPSNASFSIRTTGNLTVEMWIEPTVLQFPYSVRGDYVNVMGKCVSHPNTGQCEWEARLYNTTTSQGRCNRLSGYAFNPNGGEGVGAAWQPVCGLLQAGEWLHVVAEYTTDPTKTPAGCDPNYPGTINIWVNSVEWNQSYHGDTGCWNQPSINTIVVPQATSSPLNIGTVDLKSWFKGAIGKVAIYNYLLTQSQITNHYQTMTGQQPTGSCAAMCSF